MQMRSLGTRLTLLVTLVLPLVSCQYLDQLQAMKVIKDAHTQYQRADYPGAAALYEEAIANDPTLQDAYFYLANWGSLRLMFRFPKGLSTKPRLNPISFIFSASADRSLEISQVGIITQRFRTCQSPGSNQPGNMLYHALCA